MKQFFILAVILSGLVLPPPASYAQEMNPELVQARNLEDEGQYLEARAIYERLAEDPNLSLVDHHDAMVAYENLNMKLLVSRIPTEDSENYTVQPGDSLYKIARKFHTTIDLIKKSNGLTSDTIYPDQQLKVNKTPLSIKVDKSDNYLYLRQGSRPLKTYKVATGKDNKTPIGTFKITDKLVNPTWYNAGAVVSPDSPKNMLGTRWLGFDYPGYGIHGTTLPETIGQQATAGCVRMLNQEVEELYSLVPSGTEVIIVD